MDVGCGMRAAQIKRESEVEHTAQAKKQREDEDVKQLVIAIEMPAAWCVAVCQKIYCHVCTRI